MLAMKFSMLVTLEPALGAAEQPVMDPKDVNPI